MIERPARLAAALPLLLAHASVLDISIATTALQWPPCDGQVSSSPPALWGNGQVFAAGAVGDDAGSSVFVGEKLQFSQQRWCEIFDTNNSSGCDDDLPAEAFNGSAFVLVRVPSDTTHGVPGHTAELRLPKANPATPKIVTGDAVLFAAGDGSGAGSGVFGFAFAAQDTVVGVLPPGSQVALDGVVASVDAAGSSNGSCVCSSGGGLSAADNAAATPADARPPPQRCHQTSVELGVKYNGGDFHQVVLPANVSVEDNAAACSRACCSNTACRAWTYAVAKSAFGVCAVGNGCCYLKNAMSRLSPRPGAASGSPQGSGGGGGGGQEFCACAWRSADGNVVARLSFDGTASRAVPTAGSVQRAVSARLALLCSLTPPARVPASQRWLFYKAVSTMKANVLGSGGNLSGPSQADGRLTWGSAVFGWSQPMYAAAWRFAAPHLPVAETLFETFADVVAAHGMEPHETTPTTVDVRLTNPPLLAWAAWEAYQRANDTAFLRRVYPALSAYLEWDMAHRDTNNNSLLEWSASFESGLDLSPRWDDGSDFDAVDFSAYAAHDALRLADIAGALGLDAGRAKWLALAGKISDAVHALLWDDEAGCYRDRFKNGSLSDVDSFPAFAPLLLPSTPAPRVASMAARLRSACYQTRWLFPTVSTCDRRFEVDCMRGGLWPALNWILGAGLHSSGLGDLARELDNSTVEVIRTTALRLGPLYEFFDPTGATPPDRVQRKGRHGGGSRDVAWTAGSLLAIMARSTPQ